MLPIIAFLAVVADGTVAPVQMSSSPPGSLSDTASRAMPPPCASPPSPIDGELSLDLAASVFLCVFRSRSGFTRGTSRFFNRPPPIWNSLCALFFFYRCCKGLHSGGQGAHESNLRGYGGRPFLEFTLRGEAGQPERARLPMQEKPGQGAPFYGRYPPSEKPLGSESGKNDPTLFAPAPFIQILNWLLSASTHRYLCLIRSSKAHMDTIPSVTFCCSATPVWGKAP